MKARATHDVVATIGEYTDREGNTKKRYMNCGVVFTGEDGNMSVKLNGLPVTPDWSGFLSLYPKEERQPSGHNSPSREPQRQAAPQQQSTQNPNHDELLNDGDSIPF